MPRTEEVIAKSPESVDGSPVKPRNTQGHNFYPGKIVSAGTDLPDGWVYVQFDGGSLQAWPKADPGFDPEIRRKTLSAVDKAWQDFHIATQDNPHPKAARMVVNTVWSDLFPNQQRWGDDCVIVVNDSYFDDEAGNSQPRFRIEGPKKDEQPKRRR